MNITGTFSAVDQQSITLSLAAHQDAEIILTQSGSNPYRVDLVQMSAGDTTSTFLRSFTGDTASTRYTNTSNANVRLRLKCVTIDSGDAETVAYTLRDTIPTTGIVEIPISHGRLDAGVPGGWVLTDGAKAGVIATLAKAKTGVYVYVPLSGLHVGDRIVGMYLTGNLKAASTKHTLVDFVLYRVRAALAGSTPVIIVPEHASANDGSGFSLDVQTNTLLGKATTQTTEVDADGCTVISGDNFYVRVSGTTADDDACAIELDAVVLQIIPA